MSDAIATMGSVLPEDVGGRDAVHVAVIAVTAQSKLVPGQDVAKDGSPNEPHVGIADPFLKRPVFPGERFWLFLYPRTITSLCHVWAHPAFTDDEVAPVVDPSRAASEAWLRDFCARSDCPAYEAVLGAAALYIDGGGDDEYLHFQGSDAHGEIPPEFWDHVEGVLGRKPSYERPRPAYFSCSC